jgi:hypothetical protein
MKQREHEALDGFAVFEKSLTARGRRGAPLQRVKLPKHANEATGVF